MWLGFAVAACSTAVPACLPVYILSGIAVLRAAEIPMEHACLYSNAEGAPSATSHSPCYPTCRLPLTFSVTSGRPSLLASSSQLGVARRGGSFVLGSTWHSLHLWGYLTSTCRVLAPTTACCICGAT